MTPFFRKSSALIYPTIFALLVAVASITVLFNLKDIKRDRLTEETRLVKERFSARLETHLATRLNAGFLLSARIHTGEKIESNSFAAQTALLHELFGDFQALNWVDPQGVIRIVTPENGNLAALNLDLRQLPLPAIAFATSKETGNMQVTPPIELAQGGRGFAAYLPIIKSNQHQGSLNLVFRAAPLISGALENDNVGDYDFRVLDGDSLLYTNNSDADFVDLLCESEIKVGNRIWSLQVAPIKAQIVAANSLFDKRVSLAGVMLSILGAGALHHALIRKRNLRISQDRVHDFTAASSDFFWETDANLRMSWVSEGIENIFAVSREQFFKIRKRDLRAIIGDTEKWAEISDHFNAQRPFTDLVCTFLIKGERIWIRASGSPRFAANGKFLGYRGTLSDATELAQSKIDMSRANALLANAVEELSETFSLWDSDDKLVFGNKTFRKLNSDIPNFIRQGTKFKDFLTAAATGPSTWEFEGSVDAYIERSLERRKSPNSTEFEIKRLDGIILQLREQELDFGGRVTIGQDITQQRENAEALRASEERLSLSVQQLSIWDWNLETKELYMSPGIAEHLGYSQKEFESAMILPEQQRCALFSQIVHPEDASNYNNKLRDHFDNPASSFTIEYRLQTKLGDYRWFLAIGQSVVNERGKATRFTGVLTDVTERVDLEERLLHSQKMEAIGQLTGGIAHDFNNLLAVILGNFELVRELHSVDEIDSYIDAGIQATQRGADLVNSMLSFARKSRLKPEPLDLNQMAKESKSWFDRTLAKNIELELNLCADIWITTADLPLAQTALLNLVLNSRDAMPDGGKLRIETRNVSADQISFAVPEISPESGNYVVLSVSDTGLGIKADEIDKIFQPFFTTKAPGAGSGLGLSMIQGFMEQTGGKVAIESKPGMGTSIQLFFPADGISNTPDITQPKTQKTTSTGGAKILLVEDEQAVLTVFEHILSRAGYQVICASTGDQAIALGKMDMSFDLLITDIIMPGVNQGNQVAEFLRTLNPELPVIFVSGYSEQHSHNSAPYNSNDLRLMKPIDTETLIRSVEVTLAQHHKAKVF
jgi:PAS domain S-box-containing protein